MGTVMTLVLNLKTTPGETCRNLARAVGDRDAELYNALCGTNLSRAELGAWIRHWDGKANGRLAEVLSRMPEVRYDDRADEVDLEWSVEFPEGAIRARVRALKGGDGWSVGAVKVSAPTIVRPRRR
jgi:Ser/Thr protein kinase RdoA (MazF antagonist)